MVAAVAPAVVASAHTETDLVAVPAGSTATVTFEPEHGCGDSPTIDMRVQSPVAGATAVERDGWTATSTPNADGTTVLEWSGGSQPADEEGEFQVRFQVPDAVGTLLVFPAVQSCENGEQEAWIETGADAESPAPQLLVLAAGAAPAASLDDVAADAPGRDLLVAALSGEADDDDGGAAPATTDRHRAHDHHRGGDHDQRVGRHVDDRGRHHHDCRRDHDDGGCRDDRPPPPPRPRPTTAGARPDGSSPS